MKWLLGSEGLEFKFNDRILQPNLLFIWRIYRLVVLTSNLDFLLRIHSLSLGCVRVSKTAWNPQVELSSEPCASFSTGDYHRCNGFSHLAHAHRPIPPRRKDESCVLVPLCHYRRPRIHRRRRGTLFSAFPPLPNAIPLASALHRGASPQSIVEFFFSRNRHWAINYYILEYSIFLFMCKSEK